MPRSKHFSTARRVRRPLSFTASTSMECLGLSRESHRLSLDHCWEWNRFTQSRCFGRIRRAGSSHGRREDGLGSEPEWRNRAGPSANVVPGRRLGRSGMSGPVETHSRRWLCHLDLIFRVFFPGAARLLVADNEMFTLASIDKRESSHGNRCATTCALRRSSPNRCLHCESESKNSPDASGKTRPSALECKPRHKRVRCA